MLVAAVFTVTVAVGVGAYFYVEKAASATAETGAGAFFAKISTLFHHKKTVAVATTATTTKPVTVATNEPPPVRFDFYNELPNMQMPPDDNLATAPSAPPPVNTIAALTPTATVPSTSTPQIAAATPVGSSATAQPATTAPPPATSSIVDADEISRLLATEKIVATDAEAIAHYVLRIGSFQSEQAANRLRDAIASVGFDAAVVKIKQGRRNLYHVQQGPYDTAALAKESQQRLEKRGITSVIQKESA